MVTPEGVSIEPERISSIASWPEPTSAREVLMFMGFTNFYRKFIEGYSRIALPLTRLTREEYNPDRPKLKGQAAHKRRAFLN